jgi:hypothetical protein
MASGFAPSASCYLEVLSDIIGSEMRDNEGFGDVFRRLVRERDEARRDRDAIVKGLTELAETVRSGR